MHMQMTPKHEIGSKDVRKRKCASRDSMLILESPAALCTTHANPLYKGNGQTKTETLEESLVELFQYPT